MQLLASGQIDEEWNKLVANISSNGRFHSDWLSMMYSRLQISRRLLSDDWVIMVSIDDNELWNLLKIWEEIFWNDNIEQFVWQKKWWAWNTEKILWCITEYIVCFFKNKKAWVFNYQNLEREYKYKDEFWKYNMEWIEKTNKWVYERPTMLFPIIDPETWEEFFPSKDMRWTLWEPTVKKKISKNKIKFDYDKKKVYVKKYADDYAESQNVYLNLLTSYWSLATAKDEIEKLFWNRELFPTPKPTQLIKHLLGIATKKDSIVLDFFSWSWTTADAVMQLNAEDWWERKYIMVQLEEECKKWSEAAKEWYKNICEIWEERIRKASKKIKEETDADIDYWFKLFKVDSSNMKDSFYIEANTTKQSDLFNMETNIKEGRTWEDLIIQVMLNLWLQLDAKIEEKEIWGNNFIFVENNEIIACFDSKLYFENIEKIAEMKPLGVVFKDESFKSDNDKINLQEQFKKMSPNTRINIL